MPGKDDFASLCASAKLTPKIAFIGGGNMAQALSKGFLKNGLVEKDMIAASDPSPACRAYLEKELQIRAYATNSQLLDEAKGAIVILAVKPQYVDGVLDELAKHYWAKESSQFGLLLSIVTGTTLQKMYSSFTVTNPSPRDVPGNPIIRIMPNTPALIGCGASVYSKNAWCSPYDDAVVKSMMGTVGICYEVPESQMDAVTGLTGSGPAYIYTVIDALADGGVKMGLPRELAIELSAQMVMGSAKMVLETGKHPGELKNQVCSPGGTTIAGIHVLEERGVRAAFMSAVEAATKRAKELQ